MSTKSLEKDSEDEFNQLNSLILNYLNIIPEICIFKEKKGMKMTIQETQEKIVKEFENYTDWEDKYAHLIELGKKLNDFPEKFRTDKNKIEGCQSQVWFNAEFKDGKIYLYADSDSTIVKGLTSLLVNVYSGHTPAEILSSPPDFIHKIGIDNHLSPTRKNGLGAMLKQIQLYAVAFNALNKG